MRTPRYDATCNASRRVQSRGWATLAGTTPFGCVACEKTKTSGGIDDTSMDEAGPAAQNGAPVRNRFVHQEVTCVTCYLEFVSSLRRAVSRHPHLRRCHISLLLPDPPAPSRDRTCHSRVHSAPRKRSTSRRSRRSTNLSGGGNATHLGLFTITSRFNVTPPSATGTATWTASNGEQLSTSTAGIVVIAFPEGAITETHTITGGTGRFAGASGTLIVERVLNLLSLKSTATVSGSLTLDR